MVKEVRDMLDLPSRTTANILLRHYKFGPFLHISPPRSRPQILFRWNKDRLIGDYSESEKKAAAVLKDAGISSLKLEKKLSAVRLHLNLPCHPSR